MSLGHWHARYRPPPRFRINLLRRRYKTLTREGNCYPDIEYCMGVRIYTPQQHRVLHTGSRSDDYYWMMKYCVRCDTVLEHASFP
jgi:hypothetical protein